MSLFLYDVASWAIVGWVLMIVLPTWRVTRWLVRQSVFPVILSALYVAGIVPPLVKLGPGILRDFGSSAGVIHLLSTPDFALIAWIHILAFDQAVAVMIYRDNQQHRWLPLPVQSVVLFATLMLGPLGFLTYLALRAMSRGRRGEDAAAAVPAAGRLSPEPGLGAALGTALAGG